MNTNGAQFPPEVEDAYFTFAIDSSFLRTASKVPFSDGTARVWRVATGDELLILRGHSAAVTGIAVSTDCRFVVSASCDGTLRIWNLSTGALQKTLRGHTGYVTSVVVVEDARAISGSLDHTVRLWDLATGAMLAIFTGESRLIYNPDETPFTPADSIALHNNFASKLLNWLGKDLSSPRVVISHNAPVINPHSKYKGGPLTPAFNSRDMVEIIGTYQPALWVYGHTHECDDQTIGGPGSFQINSDIPATLAVLNARILMKRVCQSRLAFSPTAGKEN